MEYPGPAGVTPSTARAAAEAAARESYGRLLAWLVARTRDVAAAEDALAEAFARAIETWPERGVPDAPEAWLFSVAERKLIDRSRRARTHAQALPDLSIAVEEAEDALQAERFPDERLKLLFICAHPAIDPAVRTPLMLQTVLGFDAQRIASAFLVAPSAMGQRLVRAKRKIRDAGLRFEAPTAEDLAPRLEAVLDAVYAAFGAGWEAADGADPRQAGLAEEAIYLGRLTTALLPDEPETFGLLALMLHAHARRAARREGGRYVPLDAQNTDLWDRALTAEAEAALSRAAKGARPGRYQFEAAIQSAHAAARLYGHDTRIAVAALYQALLAYAPSTGAAVAHAAALVKLERFAAAREALAAIPPEAIARYQPYWATLAHVRAGLGEKAAAREAFAQAIGLSEDGAVRAFLLEKAASLAAD